MITLFLPINIYKKFSYNKYINKQLINYLKFIKLFYIIVIDRYYIKNLVKLAGRYIPLEISDPGPRNQKKVHNFWIICRNIVAPHHGLTAASITTADNCSNSLSSLLLSHKIVLVIKEKFCYYYGN